jgi:flagellar biosynthesis protein FlhB
MSHAHRLIGMMLENGHLTEAIYRFIAITSKIPMQFFTGIKKNLNFIGKQTNKQTNKQTKTTQDSPNDSEQYKHF